MLRSALGLYRCPRDGSALSVHSEQEGGGDIRSGTLRSAGGHEYPIGDGIANLVEPPLAGSQEQSIADFYDGRVQGYDDNLHLTFKTHKLDETLTRNGFIDKLQLRPNSRVLEVAAGTGRDSVLIAKRLSAQGELYISDIARGMLMRCREKLQQQSGPDSPRIDYHLSNALHLPFADRSFDALYCFGALSEVSDVKACLREMVRVCKIGARIVVGATCVAPWLRDTDYAKTLITTNPYFRTELPVAQLPVEARDVCIRWGIGFAYYLIDFSVGEGEPDADFDFDIPGPRGGTYRTRYEGQLEGVTREAKTLAQTAREASGKSMHQWLDEAVREKAERDLQARCTDKPA